MWARQFTGQITWIMVNKILFRQWYPSVTRDAPQIPSMWQHIYKRFYRRQLQIQWSQHRQNCFSGAWRVKWFLIHLNISSNIGYHDKNIVRSWVFFSPRFLGFILHRVLVIDDKIEFGQKLLFVRSKEAIPSNSPPDKSVHECGMCICTILLFILHHC